MERNFALDLPQLIEKRDQLRTYFLKSDQDNEIRNMENQFKNLQNNLNSLFLTKSIERKKIAKQLQASLISILRDLGLENANFLIKYSE